MKSNPDSKELVSSPTAYGKIISSNFVGIPDPILSVILQEEVFHERNSQLPGYNVSFWT